MAEEAKTTIPEPIQDKLRKLSVSTKVPVGDLVTQMKEIIANDANIQAMPNKEHQINFACTILIRNYSRTDGGVQMYLRPLSKPRARLITSQGTKKYVGGLYGLVQLIEKNADGTEKVGDIQYAAGTLWEKAADKMRTLSTDKVYKTTLRATDAKNGLELGANDATFVEVDHKMPTNEEYFKEHIEPELPTLLTSLDDLKINHRDDQTDIRVVKATVLDAGTGTTTKMGEYGRYSVTDDSFIGKDNYPMWKHPDEIIYGVSSELYFVGTANIDNSNPETPIIRFDCHFEMPAGMILMREEEPEPIAKESEEVTLDDISGELEETSAEEPEAEVPAEPEKPAEEKPAEPKPEPKKNEFEI